MSVLAILGSFVAEFVIEVGGSLAGASPDVGFVVFVAGALAWAAVVAGATPRTAAVRTEK